MDIEVLELSVRTYSRLKQRGINTVEHLMSIPDEDLEHIFAIGVNGLAEVKEKLKTRYTNADHIRSMSDEELQKFICNNTKCESCNFSGWTGCLLGEWLKQPKENTDD